MDQDPREYAIVIIATEAANLPSVLVHIKEGRAEEATELLEQALDRCVSCLAHMREGAPAPDMPNLINALRIVQSYRRRYPRIPRANKGAVDTSAIRELEERARRILEEM